MAANTTHPTTMPAMAPLLRAWEDEPEPLLVAESLDVIVTMFSGAPWTHLHADTLKTPRS
jgi:hypothetical protein